MDDSGAQRPLLILNNGSDGTVTDMWVQGAAGALERGYNAVTFDGPGQGAALFRQQLYFRPDWEAVITPVIDHLLTRDDVDPQRIALQGISQGGYWVPGRWRSSTASPPGSPILVSSTFRLRGSVICRVRCTR